jgi:hypothetical protein
MNDWPPLWPVITGWLLSASCSTAFIQKVKYRL